MGEMSRLTGMDKSEMEKDKVSVSANYCADDERLYCPERRAFVDRLSGRQGIYQYSGDTEGKSGMATAGSGDILNGTIAAMFCLGLSIEEAVRTGVFIHGLSGDLAAKKKGPDGMTAQDILNTLPYCCAILP